MAEGSITTGWVGMPVQPTTYVGRSDELAEAARQIERVSLLTLTGPGGVGKTRMALRLGTDLTDQFSDGVVFAPLGELSSPDLVVSAVSSLVGLGNRRARPMLEEIIDGLRDRNMLLILDNCEHVLDACAALVAAINAACPMVMVLATSRQSLGVPGEHVLPVRPLPVPAEGDDLAAVVRSDAVRLFVDRATAVVPSFEVTEDNAADVARLCRQLEGVPLAIELAAIRMRSLSVGQIGDRLDEQFSVLTGDGRRLGPNRHGTLRALIDWSYDLCTPAEQLLWMRASVFAGSFAIEAAEAVCSDEAVAPGDVLSLIDALLDKSVLVREEHHGLVRYRMPETLRQYGQERARDVGQVEQLRRTHRDWYGGLTRRFEEGWIGPEQVAWGDTMFREQASLRSALDFCCSSPAEAETGMRMVLHLKEFWMMQGLTTEARVHLSRLMAVAPADSPERPHALWYYAFLARLQNDHDAFEKACAEADRLPADEMAGAYLQLTRGYDALLDDRMPAAAELFERAAARFRDEGDLAAELWARFNHGTALALSGDSEAGRAILHECVDTYTSLGEIFWRCWAMWSLAAIEYLDGNLDAAREACQEVLRLESTMRDRLLVSFALTVAAGVAARGDQPHRAARLFGIAAAAWSDVGASQRQYPAFRESMRQDTHTVTGQLGVEVATTAFSEGYAMPFDDAMAYALSGVEQDGSAPEPPEHDLLTRREAEVATLVARGMSNREIAETLVISRRTAETHVNRILTKLSLTSRTQLAAWVASTPGARVG